MATKGLHEAAAALFVDALGRDLPLQPRFSYRDLATFLRREGITGLDELHTKDLLVIGNQVQRMTGGSVAVSAEPVTATGRTPLSTIDLAASGEDMPIEPEPFIQLTDLIALHDGTQLHVVATKGERWIGMDDRFESHVFGIVDVASVRSMDAPL